MTLITVKIDKGVPMGREKQPFANALVRIGAALEHEAPGMTEGEWEAELIDQWAHKSTPNVWIDEKGSKAVTDALGLHKRQIWVLSKKVEVKEVSAVEQIVNETILQTLNDIYFLGQLRESESHIVRNELIAERKKKILDKLSPPTH